MRVKRVDPRFSLTTEEILTKPPLMANVLPKEKQVQIVSMLCEGNSIRGIERMTGVHRDSIMRLGVRIGGEATGNARRPRRGFKLGHYPISRWPSWVAVGMGCIVVALLVPPVRSGACNLGNVQEDGGSTLQKMKPPAGAPAGGFNRFLNPCARERAVKPRDRALTTQPSHR
jgi:hypothetical protein